jgi:hypothetical protein
LASFVFVKLVGLMGTLAVPNFQGYLRMGAGFEQLGRLEEAVEV